MRKKNFMNLFKVFHTIDVGLHIIVDFSYLIVFELKCKINTRV